MPRKIKFIQSSESLSKTVLECVEQLYVPELRIGMLFSSEEAMDLIDRLLWTNKQLSFIPHATNKDTDLDLQPIYLTTCAEFPNFSKVLICVDCVSNKIVCEEETIIFPSDSKSLESIRRYYKDLQGSSNEVSFTKQ